MRRQKEEEISRIQEEMRRQKEEEISRIQEKMVQTIKDKDEKILNQAQTIIEFGK